MRRIQPLLYHRDETTRRGSGPDHREIHHLFFADLLAIRQEDFGSISPEYSAVPDEAHEIEDVASDYFGRQLSSYRFEELARDTEGMLRMLRRSGDAA